ncbi:Hypothetical protein CINCED_3A002367 [Cinara cedri]|uniref:Uncharacterized protein n=1 Tax=Cinara cedri TaxID=506608 RepID=A0A5E4M9M5_9HEMI|nr:Hypothetical protein CINCED_3A002367 [Cinara cedri]
MWIELKTRPREIDQMISVEIPDPSIDPESLDIVTSRVIRGPCGAFNVTSPCASENGKRKKRFQEKYADGTIADVDGHPLYRRRNPVNVEFYKF